MALEALQWYVDEDDVIECMAGNEPWVEGKKNAETVIEALRAALALPDEPVGRKGYMLVPIALTEAMESAGYDKATQGGGIQDLDEAWSAMLAAAPKPP